MKEKNPRKVREKMPKVHPAEESPEVLPWTVLVPPVRERVLVPVEPEREERTKIREILQVPASR